DGCRVMLIGKKNSPQEEVELKKLKHLEKSVEKIADQLEELNKELTGIQQRWGFTMLASLVSNS
ncbi:BAG1 isoform 9, partial [Pongo abelii]